MQVDSSSSAAARSASTSSAGAGLAQTFDSFLTLLTTQLKNQDPISPMDTTEFTNQLVSFTNVEQQIASNTKLDQLIALQSQNGLAAAMDFIGKQVDIQDGVFDFSGDPVPLTYELSSDAATLTIEIVNERGTVIFSGSGSGAAGRQTFEWDGLTTAGTTAPDGAYQIRVTASNLSGEEFDVPAFGRGTVTGAEVQQGEAVLKIGDTAIRMTDVVAIRQDADQPAEPE